MVDLLKPAYEHLDLLQPAAVLLPIDKPSAPWQFMDGHVSHLDGLFWDGSQCNLTKTA